MYSMMDKKRDVRTHLERLDTNMAWNILSTYNGFQNWNVFQDTSPGTLTIGSETYMLTKQQENKPDKEKLKEWINILTEIGNLKDDSRTLKYTAKTLRDILLKKLGEETLNE